MSLFATAIQTFETAPAPDALRRAAIGWLVSGARKRLAGSPESVEIAFAEAMNGFPIATHTSDANAQHYEVPAPFFQRMLGPRLKYSCCLYPTGAETLAEAELAALAASAALAGLKDGQSILELGCGWGSLSLYMARTYPNARITAVSNSASQRAYILDEARKTGIENLQVITADMNVFNTARRFDRVVSVEMFEHMSNWRALLTRVRSWLKLDGRLFAHVFSHRTTPYRFDVNDPSDWIAQHFFTGGVMPSHGLMTRFPDLFTLEAVDRWDGTHYQRTANHWLQNLDANRAAVRPILAETYGAQARLWEHRWRLFLLATAGLFGDSGGREWGVSLYRMAPTA